MRRCEALGWRVLGVLLIWVALLQAWRGAWRAKHPSLMPLRNVRAATAVVAPQLPAASTAAAPSSSCTTSRWTMSVFTASAAPLAWGDLYGGSGSKALRAHQQRRRHCPRSVAPRRAAPSLTIAARCDAATREAARSAFVRTAYSPGEARGAAKGGNAPMVVPCTPWGCSCQNVSDLYGISHGDATHRPSWGRLDECGGRHLTDVRIFWLTRHCKTFPAPHSPGQTPNRIRPRPWHPPGWTQRGRRRLRSTTTALPAPQRPCARLFELRFPHAFGPVEVALGAALQHVAWAAHRATLLSRSLVVTNIDSLLPSAFNAQSVFRSSGCRKMTSIDEDIVVAVAGREVVGAASFARAPLPYQRALGDAAYARAAYDAALLPSAATLGKLALTIALRFAADARIRPARGPCVRDRGFAVAFATCVASLDLTTLQRPLVAVHIRRGDACFECGRAPCVGSFDAALRVLARRGVRSGTIILATDDAEIAREARAFDAAQSALAVLAALPAQVTPPLVAGASLKKRREARFVAGLSDLGMLSLADDVFLGSFESPFAAAAYAVGGAPHRLSFDASVWSFRPLHPWSRRVRADRDAAEKLSPHRGSAAAVTTPAPADAHSLWARALAARVPPGNVLGNSFGNKATYTVCNAYLENPMCWMPSLFCPDKRDALIAPYAHFWSERGVEISVPAAALDAAAAYDTASLWNVRLPPIVQLRCGDVPFGGIKEYQLHLDESVRGAVAELRGVPEVWALTGGHAAQNGGRVGEGGRLCDAYLAHCE
tara:strand:- start:380 stop:2695 length:2316 start_codon:yes stop_codon:yes gene_type:complete